VSLIPPKTVGKLRETLHAKAKGLASHRFYALYDKVYRADVLGHPIRQGGMDRTLEV
jgi:RNA-directed DNA polymerase